MNTDVYKKLAAAKAKVAKLENLVKSKLQNELAALPAKFGFESVQDFLKAVETAGGKRAGAKAKVARKSRKRAKITDATRAEVKKLVEAGKSSSQIAKAVGISLPSVANIKKALGLVKPRKK